MPAAALLRALRARLAPHAPRPGSDWTPAGRAAVCAALAVPTFAAARDVVNALAVSEAAYTAHERGGAEAAVAMSAMQRLWPPGLLTITSLQPSAATAAHRFVVGAAPDALVVGFMGTSDARDAVADAYLLQEAVLWGEGAGGGGGHGDARPLPDAPAAHRGFLARARSVPADALAAAAAARGARLVLAGHSLGGAVAQLVALRLLQAGEAAGGGEDNHAALDVTCVSFAAPALGNAALAAHVADRGWDGRFSNLTFADDLVPRMLADIHHGRERGGVAAAGSPRAGVPGAAASVPAATVTHEPFVRPSPDTVDVAASDAAPAPRSAGWPAVPTLLPPAAAAWLDAAAAAGADAASRAASFVPSYTHFGTRLTPALPASAAAAASPAEPTALPAWLATIAATLTPDATRLPGLAAHRVSTYRDRLAAVVAAAAGGGAPKAPPGQLPPATLLVRDLMPALEPSSARAVLPLLPPRAPLARTPAASAWAAVRRVADRTLAPADADALFSLPIRVTGRGLATARSARVSAPGPAWCAALVAARPPHAPPGGAGELVVIARLPARALREAAGRGGLVVWLRSDFGEAAARVETVAPTIVLVAASDDLLAGANGAGAFNGVVLRRVSGGGAALASALAVASGGAPAPDRLRDRVRAWLALGAPAPAPPPPSPRVPTVVAVAHSPPPSAAALAAVAAAAAAAGVPVVPLLRAGDDADAALAAYGGASASVRAPVPLAAGAGAADLVAALAPALRAAAAEEGGGGPRARL